MQLEQTIIAKKLGISNTAFRRIAENAKLVFELINNRRCYEWEDVLKVISQGNFGEAHR